MQEVLNPYSKRKATLGSLIHCNKLQEMRFTSLSVCRRCLRISLEDCKSRFILRLNATGVQGLEAIVPQVDSRRIRAHWLRRALGKQWCHRDLVRCSLAM